MFGFLKNVLGKKGRKVWMGNPSIDVATPAEANDFETGSDLATRPDLPRNAEPHNAKGQSSSSGHIYSSARAAIELPLELILLGLPLELQPKVINPNVGGLTIKLGLEKVLPQLSHGAVKISFGELRQAAPEVFASDATLDRVPVFLPLAEVLARVNPNLIKRRRVQRQIEVPPDIASPFDTNGRGYTVSVPPVKTESVPLPSPALPPRSLSESMMVGPGFGRPQAVQPPTPASPKRPPVIPTPTPPAPAAVPFRRTVISPPHNGTNPEAHTPTAGLVPFMAKAAQPAPVNDTEAEEGETDPLLIGLASLAEAWPDAVRREIVQMNLVDAKVALPNEAIERALRQGKIAFTWRLLRSWLRPGASADVSAHDSVVLELPLKLIAPLFLDRQKRNTARHPQEKFSIDEDIPNLFFGFPQAEPSAGEGPATAKPEDTNYYVWEDSADTVKIASDRTPAKSGPSAGTKFVSKYATPNEIVSRAAALDGVAGSLIALPDGLLVASRIPSDLNADTIAAFLPQIFGKVSQSTKELRMGELNNLNFTVGNVPWKIFRVNAIYFAAFGRAEEALPTAQLASLAGELDHKPK
jgi:predicted regulator of Ras-like GTPase activity (Roadblock/LC7/MglB family)